VSLGLLGVVTADEQAHHHTTVREPGATTRDGMPMCKGDDCNG